MAVNKVVMNTTEGEEVLIDLTEDTVEEGDVAEGVTFHDATGEKRIGSMRASGASVQADLAVNDENDPSYVKNRTHWTDEPVLEKQKLFDVLEEDLIPTSSGMNSLYFPDYGYEDDMSCFETGKVYTITLNGNSYECECKEIEIYGESYRYMGNAYIIAAVYPELAPYVENTGEPFLVKLNYGSFGNVILIEQSYNHKMKFEGMLPKINYHSLDANYLPNIHKTNTYDFESLKPYEVDEVMFYLSKGVPVYTKDERKRLISLYSTNEEKTTYGFVVHQANEIYAGWKTPTGTSLCSLTSYGMGVRNQVTGEQNYLKIDANGSPYVGKTNVTGESIWKPNVLTSPNGTKYEIVVNNDGTLSTIATS